MNIEAAGDRPDSSGGTRASSYFSADQPLKDPADDKLSRKRFSEEIARSIANWSGRDSLVVSLTGEWGTGKSTIKNFVNHYLTGKAHVLEFNPWQWSGQDKLLEAFLWQLGALFRKEDIAKRTKKLASRWKAYASVLKVGGVVVAPLQSVATSVLPLVTVSLVLSIVLKAPAWVLGLLALFCVALSLSFVGKVSESIAAALRDLGAFREKPLEELRSEIEHELRKLDKPVVVFVDDIDRLTDGEIKLLVQLVKANAQFPNLVFFLLFQKSIVTRALESLTSDDGSKYLSKIVQVEFAVPVASEKELQGMLTRGLDQIITRDGVRVRWEEQRWPLLFLDILWPFFSHLRDVKRFLGSFEFYFGMHLNQGTLEVNPIDLIAVEVLRMFNHDAFLAVSKSFFGRTEAVRRTLFREEQIRGRFREEIDQIVASARDEQSKSRVKQLLEALFPQATGDESSNEWKKQWRICDESSFDKYFQISTDPAKPTAYEVQRFVQVSGDRSELVSLLRKAITNNTIEDFLDFIFVTKEEIPTENMRAVTTALFDIGDELPPPKPSLFSVGLDMQCNRIIYHRLKDEDRAESTELLWKAFTDTTGFILPIHKLGLEDRSVRERREKTDFVISEERLGDFIELTVRRIRAKAEDFSLLDHKDCDYVLYRWREWSSAEEVAAWVQRVVADPARALRLLDHLMSATIINGVRRVPFLNGEAVEKFVELQTLETAVSATRVESRTETDLLNISLLQKALMLKEEGKAYSEVKAKGSEF